MLLHYLKITVRNLWRHRADSTINIVGLCIAFTSALLLLLSVAYEFSYDRFNTNARHIYHVYFRTQRASGADLSAAMPAPLMPALKATYPELTYGMRVSPGSGNFRYKDKIVSRGLAYADPDLFKMLSFPIIDGNRTAPLRDLNDIVLSRRLAHAIFGDENPVGKTLELASGAGWRQLHVSALMQDFPDNSTFKYDAITPFESLDFYKQVATEWGSRFHDVFIQLPDNVGQKTMEARFPAFVNQYLADDIRRLKRDGVPPSADGSYIKLSLLPLLDCHTNTEVGFGDSINRSYLYLLMTVGLLIIAIACINFINLSIGRSFTRTKEIGLRKTMGALKEHVAMQFWTEALVLCMLAFVISCVVTWFLLPPYQVLFSLNIQRSMLASPAVWGFILLGFLLTTFIAGGYPAWLMSRLQVIDILKGKIALSRTGSLRNVLMTFQFLIAVLLISCTLISWQQIHYLRSSPLGYNTTQVISVPIGNRIDPARALRLMRDKLSSVPAVESVSGIYDNLGKGTDGSSRTSIMGFDYHNREIKSNWMGVSYDFTKTLELKLVAGRDFSTALATDSNAVVINEAMAREIGEKQPIGLKLPVDSAHPLTVIGVVKDFNFKSLRQKIDPLTLVLDRNFSINYILVKVNPSNPAATMAAIRSAWKSVDPDENFQGSFLDENVNRQYKRETTLTQLFMIGAIIAISLSSMGLLAMVILILSRRIREIGIRKVLGASLSSIILLVANDFMILVLVATLLAIPVAWYAMQQWLQGFAYRIHIEWYIFLTAGLLALAIVFVTIAMQTVRTAMANPVKSLRTE